MGHSRPSPAAAAAGSRRSWPSAALRRPRHSRPRPASAGARRAPMTEELGEGEGEVKVIAWAGYVEDGSTDPDRRLGERFEEATGCQVNVKIGNTSDEMFSSCSPATTTWSPRRVTPRTGSSPAGEVAPINLDLIPNYADVFEGLKDKPCNTVDGVPYGVPHGRGANLLDVQHRAS